MAAALAVLQAIIGLNKSKILCVAGFLLYSRVGPLIGQAWDSKSPCPRERASSGASFTPSDDFAETLLPILSFGLAGLVQSKRSAWRHVALIWLAGFALVVTQSRGPWLAAVVMGLFAFLMSLRNGDLAALPVYFGACDSSFALVGSPGPGAFHNELGGGELNNERLRMWQAGATRDLQPSVFGRWAGQY